VEAAPAEQNPPGGLCDHVEELLRGKRLGRWQMPDLPGGIR
jgi:hypothetical protein